MITFKQFISEAKLVEAKELIDRDCAPFLAEAKGAGFLYRGVNGFNSLDYEIATAYDGEKMIYATKTVRTDRKPLSTDRDVHYIIDKWFVKNLGFPARSGALFTFGEKHHPIRLKQYGEPCVVFPVGPIKYAWSPKVRDLYVTLNYEDWKKSEYEENVDKALTEAGYRTDGLDEAINTNSEIMIQCEKYYAFQISHTEALQISLDIIP